VIEDIEEIRYRLFYKHCYESIYGNYINTSHKISKHHGLGIQDTVYVYSNPRCHILFNFLPYLIQPDLYKKLFDTQPTGRPVFAILSQPCHLYHRF